MLDKIISLLTASLNKTCASKCCWLVLLTMLSSRLNWLRQQTYPISTDGFYYLLQYRSIAEFGSPDVIGNNFFSKFFTYVSPTLWFGGLLTRTGYLNPEQTFHIIIGLLLVICVYALLLLTRSSNHAWFAPLFTSSFIASDLIFYRLYAFPRHATAMSFSLLSIAWLLANKKNNVITFATKFKSILALTLTALSHIIGGIIVIGLILAPKLSSLSRLIFFIGIIGALLILIFIPASEPFIPSFFFRSPNDLLQIEPTLVEMCHFADCSPFEWFELSSVLIVTLFLSFRCTANTTPLLSAILMSIFICNLPIWNQASHLSFRLAVCSLWIMWFFFALFFNYQNNFGINKAVLPLALLSIFILSAFFLVTKKNYRITGIPPEVIQKHRLSLISWIPKNGIIEAPHGSQFRLTYFLKRASVHFLNGHLSSRPAFKVYQAYSNQEKDCFKLSSSFTSISKEILCVTLDESWTIRKL